MEQLSYRLKEQYTTPTQLTKCRQLPTNVEMTNYLQSRRPFIFADINRQVSPDAIIINATVWNKSSSIMYDSVINLYYVGTRANILYRTELNEDTYDISRDEFDGQIDVLNLYRYFRQSSNCIAGNTNYGKSAILYWLGKQKEAIDNIQNPDLMALIQKIIPIHILLYVSAYTANINLTPIRVPKYSIITEDSSQVKALMSRLMIENNLLLKLLLDYFQSIP